MVRYLLSLLKARSFKLPELVLRLLPFVDSLAIKILNLKPVRKDKIGAISIRIKRYKGHPIRLEPDTEIKTGDPLIELHVNNAWFLHYGKTISSLTSQAWAFASAFADDLRHLAKQLGRFNSEIKALHGVTLFHEAASRFGFTVMEIPEGLWKLWNQIYLNSLRQTYFPGAKKIGTKFIEPKEVWISRVKFLQKYGPREEHFGPKT